MHRPWVQCDTRTSSPVDTGTSMAGCTSVAPRNPSYLHVNRALSMLMRVKFIHEDALLKCDSVSPSPVLLSKQAKEHMRAKAVGNDCENDVRGKPAKNLCHCVTSHVGHVHVFVRHGSVPISVDHCDVSGHFSQVQVSHPG